MDKVAPSPASPRPAATVIVARDAGAEIEVLLAQRAPGLKFMANAHVFPGGALHAGDRAEALSVWSQRAAHAWPGTDDPELDRALAWTAVRETWEEVGLLLTTQPEADLSRVRELRRALHSGAALGEVLEQLALPLDLSALVPLIRWITPQSEPVRFDTRFYVARAPASQTLEPDGTETTAAIWCAPKRAIAESDQKMMILSPPTRRTLLEIADVTSVTELLERAQQQPAATVEPIMRIEPSGERLIVFPGDRDHPNAERVLRGPTRTIW